MIKYFISVLIVVLVFGCTDPKGARRVLEQNGYSNIEITGYDFWGCSKDDTFKTGFKATSPNGNKVEGCVCSGLLKGNTIRFK